MKRPMRIGMIAPVAWRTPPRHYGPWERVVSLITEGLIDRGVDVTLFATGDSVTRARLSAVVPSGYEEAPGTDAKVAECMHIANAFEHAGDFDLIHNHFDFHPLTYSKLVDTPLVTTIHGFSSPSILPVYRQYNETSHYVAISDADRSPELDYVATIHHGIDIESFTFRDKPDDYLLFFGRIHHDKGAREAIEIARRTGSRLVMAGIIQDQAYYRAYVEPFVDGDRVRYVGSVGPLDRDRLLGGARGLLHPIHFAEPFGLSVVEAFACGTPVIAFRLGSMGEIVRDGTTGFLVTSVEEAVGAVSRLPEIDRQRCRAEALERFSSCRMVQDYLRVYEQLLGRASGVAA